MGHLCGSICKRKTGQRCETCRIGGGPRLAVLDAHGKPEGKDTHDTPHEKGAAADMYYDGLSYRRMAENIREYFDRETLEPPARLPSKMQQNRLRGWVLGDKNRGDDRSLSYPDGLPGTVAGLALAEGG